MKRMTLAATAVSAVLKLLITFQTFGTNDIYRYKVWGIWGHYLGVNAYKFLIDITQFPSMLYFLYALVRLESATHVPFGVWLRLLGIVADIGSVWLVCQIVRDRLHKPGIALAVVFFALSPAALMVTGFHGNTDPVMVFFILLAVHLTREGRSPWIAGGVMGLAVCLKAVPLILFPAFIFYFAGVRRAIMFLAGASAVVMVCSAPYLFQDPGLVLRDVLGYRSAAGVWGLSWIIEQVVVLIPSLHPVESAYQRFSGVALLAIITVVSYLMNRPFVRRDLFFQCGAAMFIFLTLSPGFGVQYLTWLFPWAVALGAPAAALLYAISSVFLFSVYNFWAGGLPWYLADAIQVGKWKGVAMPLQLLCWLSVVVCTGHFFVQSAERRVRGAHATGAILAVCLIYVFSGALLTHSGGPETGVDEIMADKYEELSGILLRQSRYADTVSAAMEALRLNPNMPVAYNNIATADDALGKWDDAIRNARKALQLDPGLIPAARSLNHAAEQMRLAEPAR
jgi:hypothetical protein